MSISSGMTSHRSPIAPRAGVRLASLLALASLAGAASLVAQAPAHAPAAAALRRVGNAGSVLEDSAQRWLAHMVEHMAFSGTTHFKKQQLVDYLESTGVRFGADLNASTSFDETINELTVPPDSAKLFDKGFQILADWSRGLTFDSTELARERGVVIEEWRLGRGAAARKRDKQFPVIFS